MGNRTLKNQQGSIVLYVIAGVAAVSVMAVIGTTVLTNILSGGQRSNLTITTGQILTQAAYTLTTETNTAGSYPIAPTFLVATPNPTNGGQIPTTSAAPKVDAWGTEIGYCTNTAASQGDPVFAVLSAGADKTFQTTCAQALIGTVAGDDGVRAKNVTNIKQGVGGTVYWGDPVASLATLESLTDARAGELRSTKDTGSLYINKTGMPGQGYWSLIGGVSAVAAAVPNPPVATPPTGGGGGGTLPALPTLPSLPELVPSIPTISGTLWANGFNGTGQFGVPTADLSGSLAPIELTSLGGGWGLVSGGSYSTYAIKTDGTLWSWGGNVFDALGQGGATSSTTPVKIGTDSNWAIVQGSQSHAAAIKSDGTLWTWGRWGFGALGNGNTFGYAVVLSPAKVGIATNWSNIHLGMYFTAALKADGTIWASGNNTYGQLANGTTTTNPNNALAQVGSSNMWRAIGGGESHVLAIKSDGTLWAWGRNTNGQLGDGTKINAITPVQVGIDTNWAYVGHGLGDFSVALKSDGSIWSWGRNAYGNLCNSGGLWSADVTTPTQVAGTYGFSRAWAADDATIAIKADGTRWACGWNANAETGNGNQILTPELTKIGVSTTWINSVGFGLGHVIGISTP